MKRLFAFALLFALFAHLVAAEPGLSCPGSSSSASEKVSAAVYKLDYYSEKLLFKQPSTENGALLSIDEIRGKYADAFREAETLRVCASAKREDRAALLSPIPTKQQIIDELFRQYEIDSLALEADSLEKLAAGKPGLLGGAADYSALNFGLGDSIDAGRLNQEASAIREAASCMLDSKLTLAMCAENVAGDLKDSAKSSPMVKALLAEEGGRAKAGGIISGQARFDIFYGQARELEGPLSGSEAGDAAKSGLKDWLLPCLKSQGGDTPKSLYEYFGIDGIDKRQAQNRLGVQFIPVPYESAKNLQTTLFPDRLSGKAPSCENIAGLLAPILDAGRDNWENAFESIYNKRTEMAGIAAALQNPIVRVLAQTGADAKAAIGYLEKEIAADEAVSKLYEKDGSLRRQSLRAIQWYSRMIREYWGNPGVDQFKVAEAGQRINLVSQKANPNAIPCAGTVREAYGKDWRAGAIASQLALEFLLLPRDAETGPAAAPTGGFYLLQPGLGFAFADANWTGMDESAKRDSSCAGLLLVAGGFAKDRLPQETLNAVQAEVAKSGAGRGMIEEFEAARLQGNPLGTRIQPYFTGFKDSFGESKRGYSNIGPRAEAGLMRQFGLLADGEAIAPETGAISIAGKAADAINQMVMLAITGLHRYAAPAKGSCEGEGDVGAGGCYLDLVKCSAEKTGLDPCLLLAIMKHESSCNVNAMGGAGECGLMQVMPAWFQNHAGWGDGNGILPYNYYSEPNFDDPLSCYIPANNIEAGAAVFARSWTGDRTDSLCTYNAGHPIPGGCGYASAVMTNYDPNC
ncbi:MAG: transglycosylase SLT domain-containing protein [Candidatus Micrarchaeia archaeon]|jgi:hypothetical protein